MKIVGADGPVVLVDLERAQEGVALACVVRGSTVSPALPLLQFTEAGLYDQDVTEEERKRVLARVREANPELGVALG